MLIREIIRNPELPSGRNPDKLLPVETPAKYMRRVYGEPPPNREVPDANFPNTQVVNEMTKPETMIDAINFLRTKGWSNIGMGGFSTVLQHQNYPYVLKIFTNMDTAYQKYVNLISRIHNSYFPQLVGKPMRINDTYWGVRMEKLVPLKNHYITNQLNYALQHMYNLNLYPGDETLFIQDNKYIKEPELVTALLWINTLVTSIKNIDIMGNVMMRPLSKHIVIIDPLYS